MRSTVSSKLKQNDMEKETEKIPIQMQLFNIAEYTAETLKNIMLNNYCRMCIHHITLNQGYERKHKVQICNARTSNRTQSGFLKIKASQPACILFQAKKA